MPLLCAAALVQSMRRETVWHVTREGDSSLPDLSDSSSSVHLGLHHFASSLFQLTKLMRISTTPDVV